MRRKPSATKCASPQTEHKARMLGTQVGQAVIPSVKSITATELARRLQVLAALAKVARRVLGYYFARARLSKRTLPRNGSKVGSILSQPGARK